MARDNSHTDPEARIWETHNVEDHMQLMRRQVMRSLEDPETRKLARMVADGRGESVRAWGQNYRTTRRVAGGDCCDITQVWNFCVLNVRYVKDPNDYDLFCTVKRTLADGIGDCDDMTILQGALLKALGWRDVRARVISVDGRRWAHVYAMVAEQKHGGGKLIALDPTVKDAVPGWEFAKAKKTRDFAL